MQSLRNDDLPAWGRRADGDGLAGGAAVALAEKRGLYPMNGEMGHLFGLRHEHPGKDVGSFSAC
jgi:hypothetical protein